MGRKRITSHAERHVRLYHRMLKTPAWRSLSATARAIYLEIEQRYGGIGSNNGRIVYSVRMASEAVHIGKDTAARALIELQQRGFLKATKHGAFSLKTRHASEWMLTAHVSDISSHAATKEYEQWQPSEIQNTVPATVCTCDATERSLWRDRRTEEKFQTPADGTWGATVKCALGTCSATLVVYHGGTHQ